MIASVALLALSHVAEHCRLGRGQVAEQSGRDRNICCGGGSDRVRGGGLVAIRHDDDGRRLSYSGRSQIRSEFVWRDLLRTGGAGTGVGDGRRDSRSAKDIAGSGGLGRRGFRGALYRSDADAVCWRSARTKSACCKGLCRRSAIWPAEWAWRWMITPFAVMLSLSIAGIGSAWMGGSARIPFVAGLDSYMPSWLGKVHPKYATPHAALIVQASRSLWC